MIRQNWITNPFPGLRPYGTEDAPLFFGRDDAVDEILERLAMSRILAVLGPSGSGKSSLLRAGVIPAIVGGALGAGNRWKICTFCPGSDPIENMASALKHVGIDNPEPTLRASRRGLVNVASHSDSTGEQLLLIVEQFEEIFRFRQFTRSEDQEFFAYLLAEAAHSEVQVYIVITLRADFLGDLSALPALPDALSNCLFLMPRMTRWQLKEAIEGPMLSAGGTPDRRLVEQLLNDVGEGPDSLVRFQHVLMRIWENWLACGSSGQLTLTHYQSVGTIGEALNFHAEAVFHDLTEADQVVAKKLFQWITEEEPRGYPVRRPASLQQIAVALEQATEQTARVVDHFQTPGFLVRSGIGADAIVDITHEALLRTWDRLKQWIQEEIKFREAYVDLSYRAKAGHSLLVEPDLTRVLDWWESRRPTEIWASRYDSGFQQVLHFVKESQESRRADHRRAKFLADHRIQSGRSARLRRYLWAMLAVASIFVLMLIVLSQHMKR